MQTLKARALDYHELDGKPGKIDMGLTKPCSTAEELSLAYSPGVAHPVLGIDEDPENAYRYTGKGNLVAVVTNGTAILGLGDRGALASKPVMEGKGVLFKRFADIDVFDIEVDEKDSGKLIDIVKAISPTFGGINLEDIGAPHCFEIERTLKEQCDIPVFHDDQHGTAVICTAGVMNVAEITGRRMDELKVVFSGAGAAGISCAKMLLAAGVRKDHLVMTDINGVVHTERGDLTRELAELATDRPERTLAEAVDGADVFIGLSAGNVLKPEMLLTMNDNPVVFAMANPTPEISYELAMETRDDLIMGTGRSDYPNQVNNVLCFPFLFRGALDVRATSISEGMKMAAAKALAELTRQPVPEEVVKAYGRDFSFGREYIVPKPFDPRVIEWVAVAVAKAACEEGLAHKPVTDWDAYAAGLHKRMEKHWQ